MLYRAKASSGRGRPGSSPAMNGILSFIVFGIAAVSVIEAQSNPEPLSILQGRPDETNTEALLGPLFDDPIQGIALRQPAGFDLIRQGLPPEDIVEFVRVAGSYAPL